MRKVARFVVGLVALACVAAVAHAQVLYKWIDDEGKVHYSDTPPKNFKGQLTKIETDVAPTPTAPPAAAPSKAAPTEAGKAEAPAADDFLTQRRAKRAALEARLKVARANLDSAKKALAAGADPQPDEQQVIRQDMKQGQGGMHGLSTARSNCRKTVKDGKEMMMCPALLATDAYYERIGKLEVAVRQAEEELDDAEQAWRRGVD